MTDYNGSLYISLKPKCQP